MSKHGVELLIHIGMDTVKLNGRGFDVKVKAGDQVKAGDLLAEFDMDLIKSEGYPVTTAVVITNTDDCEAIGEVKTGADYEGYRCSDGSVKQPLLATDTKFLSMTNSRMYVTITANTGRDKEPKKINKIKKNVFIV